MTHINKINESDHAFAALNAKVSKNKAPDAFENAFNKALDKTQSPGIEHTAASGLGEIASKDLKFLNSSEIVSDKTETLLKLLDSYSAKLEDPNIPLKQIAPILEEINTSASRLLNATQQLTGDTEELKTIATQTIATAQTEYLKFQRGDYLS